MDNKTIRQPPQSAHGQKHRFRLWYSLCSIVVLAYAKDRPVPKENKITLCGDTSVLACKPELPSLRVRVQDRLGCLSNFCNPIQRQHTSVQLRRHAFPDTTSSELHLAPWLGEKAHPLPQKARDRNPLPC